MTFSKFILLHIYIIYVYVCISYGWLCVLWILEKVLMYHLWQVAIIVFLNYLFKVQKRNMAAGMLLHSGKKYAHISVIASKINSSSMVDIQINFSALDWLQRRQIPFFWNLLKPINRKLTIAFLISRTWLSFGLHYLLKAGEQTRLNTLCDMVLSKPIWFLLPKPTWFLYTHSWLPDLTQHYRQ